METTIQIQQAVLHILDPNLGMPVFSNKLLELDLDTADFLEKMVNKIFDDDHTKEGFFIGEDNNIKGLCQELQAGAELIPVSQALASRLYQIMQQQPAILAADLVCCLFKRDGRGYLGIFKLNYKTNYIHLVKYEGETSINSLVKQKTVLPSENQRLEESVVINLENLSLNLVEKEYEIDGAKVNYFSQNYLVCADKLSTAEKVKIIGKATQKISKKYYDDTFDQMAQLKKTVAEKLETDKAIELDRLAWAVFKDDPPAQREYIEEIRKAGIVEPELQIAGKMADRKFKSQKIRTDNGIEINFPAAFFNNKEKIEFINNPDGTVSILIKNVGKIISK